MDQAKLALGKTVTASNTADAIIAPLSNLTDGNLSNYASVGNIASGRTADWIRIDLKTEQYIVAWNSKIELG